LPLSKSFPAQGASSRKLQRIPVGGELHPYGEPLSVWMKNQNIEEIIDFGDLPVFESVTTYPCILRISNSPLEPELDAVNVETLDFHDLNNYILEHRYSVSRDSLNDGGWSLADDVARKLIDKLNAVGVALGEFIGGKSYYGIKTGLNEAFVLIFVTD
jgi:hypothetical protein